jgi:hypothetical protein
VKLRPEAIAILQVFIEQGSKEEDFIHFADFGDAIVWEAGFIKEEGIRSGLQELIDGQYVVEHSAGLSVTTKGLDEIRNS